MGRPFLVYLRFPHHNHNFVNGTALFPGTFDPITLGHYLLVERGLKQFAQIKIGIGENQGKSTLFTRDERIQMLKQAFGPMNRVEILSYTGLTAVFCRKEGINWILRGLRSAQDFEYERNIAQLNLELYGVDTLFLAGDPKANHISSTLVRDIIRHGGDASTLLPEGLLLPAQQ
ncbi:MAG: pantetheine-phosphate adenylyltransferase [Bacteroidetes bacterium]|nr:pantetheine-phosphate adenylyltransferase [Bacteroidota bacterium]